MNHFGVNTPLSPYRNFDNIYLCQTEGARMPIIRPSSDLRNKYAEISTYCRQSNEPVFLTKNGSGDLAVMSMETYERLAGVAELRTLLAQGLQDIEEGRTSPVEEVFAELVGERTK
jgi:PHD/YefM family antitoxin component YafN of YafNO toxin-antitoxin module